MLRSLLHSNPFLGAGILDLFGKAKGKTLTIPNCIRRFNMKKKHASLIVFWAFTVLYSGVALSAPIGGLFNTGVDDSGAVLPVWTHEIHYAPPSLSNYAYVSDDDRWISAPTGSAWITLNYYESYSTYTYTLTFDLTGLNPATASISGRWSTDNTGTIDLNGSSTGISIDTIWGFENLYNFNINKGFVPGINTLQFNVHNETGIIGLLVSDLHGEASPIPIPGAIWLFISGLFGVLGIRRRIAS
jgi:hypothetical protein